MHRRLYPSSDRGQDSATARSHGFYAVGFSAEELARIAEYAANPTLDDELWLMRVVTRRITLALQEAELDCEQLTRVADALVRCTGRIARLLKDRRALSGEAADGIAGAIAQVLDELSHEWGVDL